jgi:hypothetical protein
VDSPLQRFLERDHDRLDQLLGRAAASPEEIDLRAYEAFRGGLLRHIAMEERVLLPEARRLRGGQPHPEAGRLRADHAVLAALLVPPPTPAILSEIRRVLQEHNPIEEGPAGVYADCERLSGVPAQALLDRLQAIPEVALAPHVDGPHVHAHIERLMRARATARE